MKVLSLFSGVGGFDLGLERAGMETVFQCEWDKHATKILERHWPDVPRWDDVSTLTGKHILAHAPVIDVVAWGSPCQDLSVAGKRAGLEGSRSGLFHEGIRIIKELRKETNNVYPRISLWENVYGALNSNKGADFGVILDEMAEAGSLVQEWRVLDAQYFGIPQRRRRVFLVSVFDTATAARCPDPLLPVSESMQRDTPTGGTPRQEPTRTTPESVASRGIRMRGFGDYADDDTASAIKARDHKDATDLVVGNPILIDRGAFNQGQNALYKPIISDDPVIPSLVARGPHAVATIMAVRRLTPLECERLMGWPDGWTEGQADTHRYKQCGNGVASPVATWIAQQLLQLDKEPDAPPTTTTT
jgi:DNA (cytosine-5)-methyltransferase 1